MQNTLSSWHHWRERRIGEEWPASRVRLMRIQRNSLDDGAENEDLAWDDELENDDYESEHLYPRVLVVGEKPAVAKSLKSALWNRPFLDFDWVEWVFTSTRGHVRDTRFKKPLPSWDYRRRCYHVAKQAQAFEQELESFSIDVEQQWSMQAYTYRQQDAVEDVLSNACESIDFLVLCLDNDLEGESIADEVESFLKPKLLPPKFGIDQQVWRCTFSSLDRDSLRRAVALPPFGTLREINRHYVDAVSVRRELDLRLGFAFSRAQKYLLWNYLQSQYCTDTERERILRICQGLEGEEALDDDHSDQEIDTEKGPEAVFNPDRWPVLSYGPCQIPTLGFVVKNDVDVSRKVPVPFWKIKAQCRAGETEWAVWSPPFDEEHLANAEAQSLRNAIAQGKPATVKLEEKLEEGYKRPHALNTPRMLELASDCLGLSPSRALDLAEDLYLWKLISYPRSETTSYDIETDLEEIARSIAAYHPESDETARAASILVNQGLEAPRQDSHDAGDHLPIMPLKHRYPWPLRGEAADLYDLICRVFLASVSPDAVIATTSVVVELPFSTCSLIATGVRTRSLGWIEVLPILSPQDSALPEEVVQAALGRYPLVIQHVSVMRFESQPPSRLTEWELLALMDKHGIGTDASMPGHIDKIIERCYVKVEVLQRQPISDGPASELIPYHWYKVLRVLHPTLQGSALFRWYMLFGEELALPTVRADVESAYLQVSRGHRQPQDVLEKFIDLFRFQFWKIFDSESEGSARARQTLVNFLKQSPQQYQQLSQVREERLSRRQSGNLSASQLWQKAEHMIVKIRFEDLAEGRQHGIATSVQSAPAELPITHCFLMDAQVLDSLGDLANLTSIRVGDLLSSIFVQHDKLILGECSVTSLRCFQPRERDLATLFLSDTYCSSVCVTSNHHFMAQRMSGTLPWGPTVVRDLDSSYVVVFQYVPFEVGVECSEQAAMVSAVACKRSNTKVIELELDGGENACWLNASGTAFVASYGEVPRIRTGVGRCVSLWGFSRCPPAFRDALRTSDELNDCREALIDAGFSFQLDSGGHMFVQPSDVQLVRRALRIYGHAPRASEVVVAPEFEVRLQEALGLVSSVASVYPRRKSRMRLDTAMGDISMYKNGRPFSYVTGDHVVTGRRTFIDLDVEDDVAPSVVTASTSDLRHMGYGRNPNPRAHASARLRR